MEANPRATDAMREFSNIRESDAEVGARRVLCKYGLTTPVPLSYVDLGDSKELKKFPWVKLSSWLQYLLSVGLLWRQLVGVPSVSTMRMVLQEFWNRYRVMDSQHAVFQLEQEGKVVLDSLIPYFSHSDEGRTFRDAPLWVLNVHGVIGRGTAEYLRSNKHRLPVHENAQGLNFIGNTWSTHLLIATMQKCVATPDALSKLLSEFAADAQSLLHDGITHGAQRFWFVHLSSKGDLPALAKIGKFTRTFGHAPRAARAKKPGRGVCYKCLAGQEQDDKNHRAALPFEDVSQTPVWEPTIFLELPWEETPSILEGLGLDDTRAIDFFKSDFFHNVHLGIMKSFSSSAIVSLIEADPPLPCFEGLGSVEKKIDRLSEMYKHFFAQKKKQTWISELSRDLVCWPMASVCPAAKWNKGMASTEIMLFIGWFAENFLLQSLDPMMKSIAPRLH